MEGAAELSLVVRLSSHGRLHVGGRLECKRSCSVHHGLWYHILHQLRMLLASAVQVNSRRRVKRGRRMRVHSKRRSALLSLMLTV